MNEKVKVIYIAGWGRSGSTLLDRILGHIEGFFSVGELRYLWDRNLIENRLCGCGARFSECGLWQEVMQEAFGGVEGVDPREMIKMREQSTRTRHLPLMLTPGGRRRASRRLAPYIAALGKLYRAIPKVTGARVVVDSSKFPSYAMVLEMLPEVELHMVHLVRDPRAVAYSWLRRKLQPDTGRMTMMKPHGPLISSGLWATWNLVTEAIWKRGGRYMLVRYEDFVRTPRTHVEAIAATVGEEDAVLPFISETEVVLGVNHTVSGNPNRFNTGTVQIRADREWVGRMRTVDRRLVKSVTWPLLAKYGYR